MTLIFDISSPKPKDSMLSLEM